MFLDDRMHMSCMLKGKHRCEDLDEIDNELKKCGKYSNCKRICQTVKCDSNVQSSHVSNSSSTSGGPSTSNYEQSNKYETQSNHSDSQTSFEFPCKQHHTLKQKNCDNLEKYDKFNDEISNNEQHTKTPKLDIELSKDEIREVMQVLNQNSHKTKNDLKQQSKNKTNILRNVILKNYHRHKDEKVHHYDNENSTNLFSKEINSSNLTFDKDDWIQMANCDLKCVRNNEHLDFNSLKKCEKTSDCDFRLCDKLCENSDIIQVKNKKKTKIYIDPDCDNISHEPKAISNCKMRDISNINVLNNTNNKEKLLFYQTQNFKSNGTETDKNKSTNENNTIVIDIPSPTDQARFRKSFDNAACMVFHSKTGLPLTSSPAPVRKGKKCFDFDSSINSVSAIKRSVFYVQFKC